MLTKLRSTLLSLLLLFYNLFAAAVLNVLMWRNNAWNEKKWSKL